MTSIVLNPEVLQGQDIIKYLPSFRKFHAWLLDEVYDLNETDSAAKDVLEFIKAGVKTKKKKIFKLYFEQFEIEAVRKFVAPLTELIGANVIQDMSLALAMKNELISLGILSFTKQYIEQITQHSPQQLEDEQPILAMSPYTQWLQGDIKPALEKLKQAYENGTIPDDLVLGFVKEFRKFIGGKLLFRITDVNNKTVAGIPLEVTSSGYEEMPHPFLNISWEVSTPIEKHLKNIKYNVGDIVEASFNESRNENFRYLLIFVDFGRAKMLPRTILDVLVSAMKPEVTKEVLNKFDVPEESDEQIQTYVIQKVTEHSDYVKEQLNDVLLKLEDQFEQVQSKQLQLEQQEQAVDEQSKQWQKILQRIDYYKALEQFHRDEDVEDYETIAYEPELFIEQLQSLFYYNNEQQLVYNKDIIRSFVYALQSNILTVLAGPSGTGKSSIVHAFAKAVENVEVRMVPVQSSWTDTQDLLGYFHPTDKAFVPTPFMEAMAEAALKENAHKIFLICLDEMNLAHVEYYFSEILSAREDDKQQIRLYSKRHWHTAKLILSEDQASVERLQSAVELIELYPPVFTIPPNVRFIGTLNMDHTVKPLSPKVIDRSFIIEINHLSATEKRDTISSLTKLEGKVEMDFTQFVETYSDEVFLQRYIDELQTVSNLFENYPNASLNSRGLKHLLKILTYCKTSEEIDQLIDYLVYGKILPRLEIKKSDFDTQASSITAQLRKYPQSIKKLQKMLDTKHTITFW